MDRRVSRLNDPQIPLDGLIDGREGLMGAPTPLPRSRVAPSPGGPPGGVGVEVSCGEKGVGSPTPLPRSRVPRPFTRSPSPSTPRRRSYRAAAQHPPRGVGVEEASDEKGVGGVTVSALSCGRRATGLRPCYSHRSSERIASIRSPSRGSSHRNTRSGSLACSVPSWIVTRRLASLELGERLVGEESVVGVLGAQPLSEAQFDFIWLRLRLLVRIGAASN